MDNNLPRVLILGQTFTTDTGGGITLANLFKNWPKDKLAIAVESKESVDFSRSSNYYRIGYKELKMPFPFSIFQRKTKAGLLSEGGAIGAVHVAETSALKSRIKHIFDYALHYSGLFFWMYGNQKTSEDLIGWIRNFDPQVIYYQPNSYKSLNFALSIKEQTQIPMITHVMDDWFSFAVRPGPLRLFWQRRLDKKVKEVFAVTQLHLSICDYMSQQYQQRYGYRFFPFHNTVDINFWESRKDVEKLNQPVKILYAGRLGYGLEKMIACIANAVEQTGPEGNVQLEIQTKDQRHPLINRLKTQPNITVSSAIPYAELPAKFAAADILLIPCDFDGPGVKFIRFSMPTKVSEYMATGVPILVIGPEKTALIEYAKEGWAFVCNSKKESEIKAAIQNLISSPSVRRNIVTVAKELARKNHDENKIVEQFREKVRELIKLDEVPSVNQQAV